jgi:hypothetical protein
MTDLISRLARAAGGVTASLDLDDLRRRADRRRRRHRAVRGVGIVGVALVVIAAAVFAVSTRSSTTDVAHPNREPAGVGAGEPGRWVPIAKAPIAPRRNAVTVWTGSEVLVFGGFGTLPGVDCYQDQVWPRCENGSSGALRSGAAYVPATNTWRRIAPLPPGTNAWQPDQEVASENIELGRLGTVALDGKVYAIVHASAGHGEAQLLSYDVDVDAWKAVATLPGSADLTRAVTIWDGRLVVYQVEPGTDPIPTRVFEPETGAWSELPAIPPGDSRSTDATIQFIGKGTRLYAFTATTSVAGTPPVPRYVQRVSVFDGTRWKTFSHPGGSGGLDAVWAATGDRFTMIVPYRVGFGPTGTTTGADPTEGPLLLTFDPATGNFAEPTIPDEIRTAPTSVQPAVVSNGRSLALVGAQASPIFDGATETWSVATGPTNEQIDELSATWAGDQLVIWGGSTVAGSTYPAAFNDRGWIWTPPSDMSTGSSSSVPSGASAPPTTSAPTGPTVSQLAVGSWRDLPMPPVPMGGDAGVVWTGKRLFAWGGTADSTEFQVEGISRRAALYDPTTRKWHLTSAATIAPRSTPTTVWTGSEVLVWGGLDASRHVVEDGAAYDPSTDSWRKLPSARAPGSPSGSPTDSMTGTFPQQAATWTGDRLVVITGPAQPASTSASGSAGSTITAAAYDPSSDRWATLPSLHASEAASRNLGIDAASLPGGPSLVWLSWSTTMKQGSDGSSTENLPGEQTLYEVDPHADTAQTTWTHVTLTGGAGAITDPIVAGDAIAATADPTRLSPEYRGPRVTDAPTVLLSLDDGPSGPVATRTAMPLGRLDTINQPQVWTGRAVVRFASNDGLGPTSSQQPGDLAALDPTSRTWTDLPRSHWTAVSDALHLVWAGDRLIVWGRLSTTCADHASDCTPGQGRRILGTELDPG